MLPTKSSSFRVKLVALQIFSTVRPHAHCLPQNLVGFVKQVRLIESEQDKTAIESLSTAFCMLCTQRKF